MLQEVELSEAVFYGLTKRVQSLMLQNISVNFRDKVIVAIELS